MSLSSMDASAAGARRAAAPADDVATLDGRLAPYAAAFAGLTAIEQAWPCEIGVNIPPAQRAGSGTATRRISVFPGTLGRAATLAARLAGRAGATAEVLSAEVLSAEVLSEIRRVLAQLDSAPVLHLKWPFPPAGRPQADP